MADDEITLVLDEIVALLEKYHAGPVQHVLELRRLWPDEPQRFRELALDNVIWGGAGSLCDVSIRSLAGGDEAIADARSFERAIVRLGEGLQAAGLADARVRDRTELFREIIHKET